ncbi:MAG: hypothetical protein R6V50_07770 [Thermoplasmatota archaeon]
MDKREHVESIARKMQEKGWVFFGPILHYKKAWKEHAAVYKKNDRYVVSGLDYTGEKELHEPIDDKEAIQRVEKSLEEIKGFIFGMQP